MIFDDFENFGFLFKVTNNTDYWFILILFNIRSPDTCLLHVDLPSKFSLAGQGSGSHYTLSLFYWNSYIGTSINYKRKMWMAPTNSQQRIWSHQLILLFEFTNKINMYHMTQWYLTSNNSSPTTFYIGKHTAIWSRKLWKTSNLPTTGNKTILHSSDNYVLMDLQNNIRTTLMQFRDTPLCVETGHFCGVLLNDKICTFFIFLKNWDWWTLSFKMSFIKWLTHLFFKYNINTWTLHLMITIFFKRLLCNFPRQSSQYIFNTFKLRQPKISCWLLIYVSFFHQWHIGAMSWMSK